MWSISKDFAFSASHQLEGLSDGHPCGRVHGHNYTVRVELTGTALDRHGFILDYGEFKPFGHWLDEQLDHRHLNDVLEFQPSAEMIARYLHGIVHALVPVPNNVRIKVSVSETPKSWASFQIPDHSL